ncbi:MAG: zinc ribbon domain-containing protein [Gammaproteobacteria bacterium]|nr:zinc ribbon domain-containing protein [Gammaproteobacteria bacterium]
MSSLSELNVPGPTVTALTEPFWAAAREGRLLIQRCRACGRAVFYPRGLCPHCWAEALDWEEASGAGRLRSFSLVRKPGHPGWTRAAPYMVGLVELREGPTMLSHLLTDGRSVAVGKSLRFAPTDIGGRILPCFECEQQEWSES